MASKRHTLAAMTGRAHAVVTAGSRYRYPWADLQPGDWFSLPGGAQQQLTVAACATQASKAHKGHRYATTVDQGRVYCVRLPSIKQVPALAGKPTPAEDRAACEDLAAALEWERRQFYAKAQAR